MAREQPVEDDIYGMPVGNAEDALWWPLADLDQRTVVNMPFRYATLGSFRKQFRKQRQRIGVPVVEPC